MNRSLSVLKVALAGNPNSGKSTLFNELTGLKQKTGNFPGVTVDKKVGYANLLNKSGKVIQASFVDLPGTYSLQPRSVDEEVACEILKNKHHPDYPDVVVVVVDATNLKRNLFLVTQIIELELPVVVALNMIDLAGNLGISGRASLLAERLGVPVVPISARNEQGISELKAVLGESILPSTIKFSSVNTNPAVESIERYNVISALVNDIVKEDRPDNKISVTHRLDILLTHRIWGYLIFLLVLFFIFQSIFYIAAFPMQWAEKLFIRFSDWGHLYLPKGELSDLLINGVLSGLSGVVIFVPQIALLFGFIALLEDTGYMARVSFIMDKLMRKFGLNGRSVIPLISGVACAVPAIMGTRTISNWKERLVTILITPLMSCSARLPVYTLLISLIFPAGKSIGFFNIDGLVLMSMYLIGFIAALAAAWVMKFIIKTKERSYFIMELPVYRAPRWSNVAYTIYDKVKVFLFDAGKVIVAISVILWVLSSHGPSGKFAEIESTYKTMGNSDADNNAIVAARKLEASYAGILGKAIEPAIAPLGFDWKIGIALISSFAAREVFVGTMATIYSVGDAQNTMSIREKMMIEKNKTTGQPLYSKAVGLSLMIFFAFAMQCMSTLAVVKRETKSWKWPIIQFLYMGVMAYGASFVVYTLFK
ncbi:MAG: ferrous iron transport protein B [Bacteroidia bacterium]|nr:ferrous iron transport protein B [Bacteroidia bacterium]